MGKINFVKKVKNVIVFFLISNAQRQIKNVIVDMVVCCNWVFIFSVYNDIESGK